MQVILQNETLKVVIAHKGAELQSIYHKKHQIEYLWNANPAYWAKKSPVLFPIVGGLKDGSYIFNDHTYKLSRHGFARDGVFSVVRQTNTSATFVLASNAASMEVYPFQHNFFITYTLMDNQVSCTYKVENTGDHAMYFSCGGHPAFSVPLTAHTSFEDWYLLFNEVENASIFPLSADGLILLQSKPYLVDATKLALQKALFYKDALVFKNLKSTEISLVSDKTPHGLKMQFHGFPFFGIWSAANADFVCLEPWCGIADNVAATGLLQLKEGIETLQANDVWERTWHVSVF